MRARRVVQHRYGGPEVLEVVDVDLPAPSEGEVMVRITATSLNPIDSKTRQGGGAAGVMGDLPISIGWDVAGVVEQVGPGSGPIALGDRVFGMPCFPRQAAVCATRAVVPAAELAAIPAGMDSLTAGALPLAGLTALSAVRDRAGVTDGQRVLVRGAGGGVGHLAVQVAKLLGAEVAAIVSADKVEFVRSLGADEVVERGARGLDAVGPVDAVIDLVGGPCLAESVAATRPGGVVVCVPGGADAGLDAAATERGVRAERTAVAPDREGLETLAGWVVDGLLQVHISDVLDLADIVVAHRKLDAGGLRGKVAIRIPDEE